MYSYKTGRSQWKVCFISRDSGRGTYRFHSLSTSPAYALTATTTIRSHRPARRLVQTYVRLKISECFILDFFSKFSHGLVDQTPGMYLLYWLCIYSSGESGHNAILIIKCKIWPWRSRSTSQTTKGLNNQGILHLSAKFGDPSLNGWCVIVQTNLWLIHADTQTHYP